MTIPRFLLSLTLLATISIPLPVRAWTMTAVGDLMLDRHVRQVIAQKGPLYPFSTIAPSWKNSDVVLANLEGPLTPNRSVATDAHLIFTFDPTLTTTLKKIKLSALSLANNHTLNFGQRGLGQTRGYLHAAGLNFFGDPSNRHGFGNVTYIDGQPVAFIGYNQLSSGLATILNDVREAEHNGYKIIVMAHWGHEYNLKFTVRQQAEAHALIAAGADLIIGSHPHVVEPLEVYRGKLIFYSLGNFLFDQYFSQNTLEGLAVQISSGPSQTTVKLLPIVTKSGQVQLLTGRRRTAMINRLATDSVVPETMRASIQHGSFTLSTL